MKYLSDVGIEVSQDKDWESHLSKLAVGEVVSIKNGNLPKSFFNLNPAASKYNLSYEVSRVELSSIPNSESGWWQVNEKTVCLAFYPSEFRRSRWYVAVDF